ncbi:MAG: ferritin family protein [Candidatus Cloacimonadaceae bacterium]|nr:ferritin family protein [Candidatus Cloacimonadaceae bacterium]MDP3113141.1 ferritin family protein [Candidatus Cloacimonadaceae bacterium]
MDRKEAFRFAIEAEMRSQMLYSALAKSFRKPENSAVYQELVILEKNHEEKVRTAFETEYPGHDLQLEPELSVDLRSINPREPKEVLDFAISREEMAQSIYLELAEGSADREMKELFNRFAVEEDHHKTILLTEIQRMQGALVWYDPSELSGLMEY